MKITLPAFLIASAFCAMIFVLVPMSVNAVGNSADIQCNGCQNQDPKKPKYCKFIVCTDSTSGFTTAGHCITPGVCKGETTQGLDGKGMEAVMKGLMDALQKLMQGQQQQQGSGSGNDAASQPPPTCSIVATTNTTTMTATSTTATSTDTSSSTATTTLTTLSWTSANATEATIEPGIGSVSTTGTRIVVPFAGTTYVLSVTGPGGYYSCSATLSGGAGVQSTASNIGDTLLNALNSSNQTSISDLLNAAANNQGTGGTSATGVNTLLGLNSDGTAKATTTVSLGYPSAVTGGALGSAQGQRGNIVVDASGAMIVAGVRTSNSETASFYGSGSSASEPKSFVGKMCESRPWASGLVSKLIPTSFFDSLCSWQGYQVGILTPSGTGAAVVRTTSAQPVQAQPQTPVAQQKLNPQAKIWAQPVSVRLGSRTSLFWTSSDVQSCSVTGPNFSANTLAGGASTVPLSGEATFTIKCSAADGTTVTQSATVTIAI